MKHFHSRIAFFLVFLYIALSQTGCRENTLINSKVSPAINAINVYSVSLPCLARTFYDDTSVTSTTLPGIPIYQGVGNLKDDFFGTMTGTTFFQVVPLDKSFGAYENMTIDSAILVLPYGGFAFGDVTGATQTYQAFYMTESLSYDSIYYSYSNKTFDPTYPLSEPTTVDISWMETAYDTATQIKNFPGLRLKLKLPVLKNYLLHADSAMINSTSSDVDFVKAFNGICIRVSDANQYSKAYPFFRLDGGTIYSQAGILVYTHTTANPADTAHLVTYYFNNNNCAHFNNIRKSYSHYPVNNLYSSASYNSPIIALQNQPGASIDIVIPGLKNLPAGVLNKAELQLTVLPDNPYGNYLTSGTFLGPEKVYPTGIGNGVYPAGIGYGLSYILSDYFPVTSLSPLSILDGYYHNMNGRRVYTVNIPREVMTSIKAKNDTIHLHINGTQDYYGSAHLVLGGSGHPDTQYRPKLFVVYSKLN
ncbi:MAG: hypothetical protein K0Q79_626 [Flavipsychrobacter sp.]|nr:hypothetical protein [Flavipsychrobacter sp.]